MYAEDKRFFPDDLPATLAAADKLWLGYSAKNRRTLTPSLLRTLPPTPTPPPHPNPSPSPNPNPTPNPNPNPNPNRLADVTWWGPRDRLRCTTTSQPGGVISSGRTAREIVTPSAAVRIGLGPSANARANARANATANANAHANANAAGDTSAILVLVLLLLATYQVRCLERVRSALGPAARLFVAVDAPKLQAIVFDELGARAFITPGT
jgi:hypothetical protein